MEFERILTKHPRILDFFKDHEQDEIDNMILSFIDLLEKCGTTTAFSNPPVETVAVNSSPPPPPPHTKYAGEENMIINRYVLDEINKEYQEFYRNRDNLIGLFKEIEKQTINLLDVMRMPFLEKYIRENCDVRINTKLQTTNQFKCELCNFYIGITKKSLSAHQRGCKKYVGSL